MSTIRYKGAGEKGGGGVERVSAHPRYKGLLFPYTQGGWAGFFFITAG
jgi:hypothetical protein